MPVIRNCFHCGPVFVESEDKMTRVDDGEDWYVVCPNHEEA